MVFRTEGVNYAGVQWETVPAITKLGIQIEETRGGSYVVDGTVGSSAHVVKSDHTPDQTSPGPPYPVRALDAGGDLVWLRETAEALRLSEDPRIKYVIFSRRMFSSYPKPGYPPYTWRPYDGPNGHLTHWHMSVLKEFENDHSPWQLEAPVTFEYTPPDNLTDEEGEVFYNAWEWAWENGLVNENTDPVDIVEKQEMMTFLHRYHEKIVVPTLKQIVEMGNGGGLTIEQVAAAYTVGTPGKFDIE